MREAVVVLIPARNEEGYLSSTVAAVRAIGASKIMVVDDASEDRTADEALESGATLVRTQRRLGKGGAVELGLRSLFRQGIPEESPVALLDADLGSSASEVARLVEAIRGPEPKLAIGIFPKSGSSLGWGLAVGLARGGIRYFSGLRLVAPLSGQRAIRAGHLRRLMPLWADFALEVGMTLDALRLGYELIEVPVQMSHRATGWNLSGIWHRGKQLVQVAGCLGAYRNRART